MTTKGYPLFNAGDYSITRLRIQGDALELAENRKPIKVTGRGNFYVPLNFQGAFGRGQELEARDEPFSSPPALVRIAGEHIRTFGASCLRCGDYGGLFLVNIGGFVAFPQSLAGNKRKVAVWDGLEWLTYETDAFNFILRFNGREGYIKSPYLPVRFTHEHKQPNITTCKYVWRNKGSRPTEAWLFSRLDELQVVAIARLAVCRKVAEKSPEWYGCRQAGLIEDGGELWAVDASPQYQHVSPDALAARGIGQMLRHFPRGEDSSFVSFLSAGLLSLNNSAKTWYLSVIF